MSNKKAISPVVATSLLLVVAVLSLIGFQSWFTSFSSQVFSNTESQTNSENMLKIETLIDSDLYVNSGSNSSIRSVSLGGVDCEISGDYSGTQAIDLSDCISQIEQTSAEVLIVTDSEVISKYVYIEDPLSYQLNYVFLTFSNISDLGAFLPYDNKIFLTNSLVTDIYFYDYNSFSKINYTNPPGYISTLQDGFEFFEFQNQLYHPAENSSIGQELFKFDGTDFNLVSDIAPGASDSESDPQFIYNGNLIISANNGTSGVELYSYDGTTLTPAQELNIGAPNSIDGGDLDYIEYNGLIYLSANDGVNGIELFSFNGTNYTLVSDINSGALSSFPQSFNVIDGILYFKASSAATGTEIFQFNGTDVSSYDMVLGVNSPNLDDNIYSFENKAVVIASNVSPSPGGGYLTTLSNGVIERFGSGNIYEWSQIYSLNNNIYVRDSDNNNGLLKFNGTDFFNLNSSTISGIGFAIYEYRNSIYFTADINDGSGRELIRENSAGTGLEVVFDINSGASSGHPNLLGVYSNKLFYTANNGTAINLYVFDGTSHEIILPNASSNGYKVFKSGSNLYFYEIPAFVG